MVSEELEELELILAAVKRLKSNNLYLQKQLNRRANADYNTHSQARIGKMNADTTWAAMDYDKAKTDFARLLEKCRISFTSDVKEYNPSPLHKYKH